jgi:hypothetical protein
MQKYIDTNYNFNNFTSGLSANYLNINIKPLEKPLEKPIFKRQNTIFE